LIVQWGIVQTESLGGTLSIEWKFEEHVDFTFLLRIVFFHFH